MSTTSSTRFVAIPVAALALALTVGPAGAQQGEQVPVRSSSYSPVVDSETFEAVRARDVANRAKVKAAAQKVLAERYDLTPKLDPKATMTGGKRLPVGPTARLKGGVTWDSLSTMSPDEIRNRNVFPYMPLPHPNHDVGGMIFPQVHIDAVPRLERFDLDFDIPEAFLPPFPPAIFLTTRPDLGDVSKGELVTLQNYFDKFDGILNPKQLDGLRLLLTQFPQQQFNATADRKTDRDDGMIGVACFDCHVNGHTMGATHLVGDIRPQENRRRIDTPTLRGVNVQRLFGSQRALKTIEDFTEFEQRAAYFDGDPVTANKKGVNVLERGHQVHNMAEFQAILDFPPAPKLDIFGRLDHAKATPDEVRGEELFFGKARCFECHTPPHYTDNTMHDLQVERFYNPRKEAGLLMTKQGPMKTFPLRGIKDSPPYLHDERLLTLEDAVEFFNIVLQVKLTADEKKDLVTYLRVL